MYAKIITKENNIYYSPVLLLKYRGLSSWAVIFDESFSKLIKISYWNKRKGKLLGPNILLINYDSKEYNIFKNNLKSIWNKKIDLLRCKFGKFSNEMLEYAKQFIRKETPNDFVEIITEDDLKALDDCSGGFHDGYLLEITKKEEYEEFLFNTTWGNYISIRTSNEIDNHITLYETISDSKYKIINDIKRIDFINMVNFENEKIEMHLSAKEMFYKPYFEKKIEIKELIEFEVEDNRLIINGKNVLPLSEETIIFSDDQDYINMFFKTEDIIYNLVIVNRTNAIDELILLLKSNNYNVSDVDIFASENIERNERLYIYEVKQTFERLDKMIKKYNSISQRDFMKKYEYFQETYKYIISLLDANLIQSDSKKKSLSYLQEILDNDGPEYSYTINFSPVHDTTVIYEIGVCVRGVPLLRKISGSTIAKNK